MPRPDRATSHMNRTTSGSPTACGRRASSHAAIQSQGTYLVDIQPGVTQDMRGAHRRSAPSTAQARSGHSAAHTSNCPAWDAQARTRGWPSCSSDSRPPLRCASSCAGRSRSSRPPSAHSDHSHRTERGPWRACLITVLALAPLSSHTTARPGRLAPRYKARSPAQPAGGSGASPPGLPNATADRSVLGFN